MDGTGALPNCDEPPLTPRDDLAAWPPQGGERRRRPRAPPFLGRDLNEHAVREPATPVYSLAEVDVVRQDCLKAGREAGLAEAALARETAEAAALVHLAAEIANARAEAATVADQAAAALAQTLLSALGAVMPELIQRSALDEAGAMLAQVLPGLSREPELRVVVRPEMRDGIAALIARLEREAAGHVSVQGDETLADGEVRVRWSAGEARRQPAAIWQTVLQMLQPALGALNSKPATTIGNTDGE